MTTHALIHGANTLTSFAAGALLPLGSLLAVRGHETIAALAEGISAWQSAPWCPVVFCLAGPLDQLGRIATVLPSGMGTTGPVSATMFDQPDALRDLVRQRVAPAPIEIAAYLACRLEPTIHLLVRMPVMKEETGLRERRRMARLGAGSPHLWSAMTETTVWLARAMAEGWSEARTAAEAGIAPKTLSLRCMRLFGIGWRRVTGLHAWEALIEAGIRRIAPNTVRNISVH